MFSQWDAIRRALAHYPIIGHFVMAGARKIYENKKSTTLCYVTHALRPDVIFKALLQTRF